MLNYFKSSVNKKLIYGSCFYSSSEASHKFNVLFFGTDPIAQKVLEILHKNQKQQYKTQIVDKLEVVTTFDSPGIKNLIPVKQFCLEKQISNYSLIWKS